MPIGAYHLGIDLEVYLPSIPSNYMHASHPILTHSKIGTSKPKAFITSNPQSTLLPTPKYFKDVVKIQEWKKTMIVEYNALVKNNT